MGKLYGIRKVNNDNCFLEVVNSREEAEYVLAELHINNPKDNYYILEIDQQRDYIEEEYKQGDVAYGYI